MLQKEDWKGLNERPNHLQKIEMLGKDKKIRRGFYDATNPFTHWIYDSPLSDLNPFDGLFVSVMKWRSCD